MNMHRLPSGLYVAEESRSREELQAIRNRAFKDYYDKHKRCPECGGDNVISTTMGYDVQYGQIDENSSRCGDVEFGIAGCGWRGVVHDLVPDPPVGIYAYQTIAFHDPDMLMGTWSDDEESSTCTNDADS